MPDPTSDRVLELRGLLQRLRVLTKDIDEDTELVEAIGIGHELWRVVATSQKAMEHIKGIARENTAATPGSYQLRGPDRTICTVTVPEPRTAMRKGLDMDDLKRELGTSFDRLFSTHVVYAPKRTFQEQVPALSTGSRQRALGAVDLQTGKPRVSFDRSRS
jgi:hypothetical protein